MACLGQEIKTLKGIGAAKARDFARLGLTTLEDAIYDFPFRYDDLSSVLPIAEIRAGQKVTVQGRISAIDNRKSAKSHRMIVTEAIVEDGTGKIKAVWFHQGFLTKVLKPGVIVSLAGKVDDRYGLSLVNPVYEVIGNATTTRHTGRIVPIYRLTGALTQKARRLITEKAIACVHEVVEWMPEYIRKDANLIALAMALREMHFPESVESKDKAIYRLKFDEFLLHQLLHAKSRRELQKQKAPNVGFHEKAVKAAVDDLPFTLTGAQKKAVWAIIQDMGRTEPMNRLLEGDVGSGKTAVAALVAVNAAADGWQTAMLAPTEILAEQHAKTLERLLGNRLRIALYTRTKRRVHGKDVTKEQLLGGLKSGDIDLVVGTHALLTEHVLFDRLGLIVVDEQHRFGVKQRQALKDKQGEQDGIPHLLSMTATPIPRSLALVLYGDLDRSMLNEYPAGRKPIVTNIVDVGREQAAYEKMRAEMDAKRQVFVVCPLIEESDALGVQSVNEVYANFAEGPFKGYTIAMLHGKLKTKEKDDVMRAFAAGEYDMLIATTVVEVGIDVPNATVMYVEGAERFGLAQLHQLRGRVGRGEHSSMCFLHPSAMLSPLARERLLALVESQNGFELAEADLRLRGPGDVFGTRQSGFEQFKLGTYADIDIISKAKDYAKELLDEDVDLKTYPKLRDRMLAYADEVHFE
ncbi:ATP-dependent DNA helicase RecG [Candidatus Uhrbacteria bacterium]|nr:ATP-dependent DNA helicase RecG [Candidatus Uhrbacteria bacterium]